jgi:phosphatidylserine/phosphatidylglycerophosphate/cardiolipin synthase-like enzyme
MSKDAFITGIEYPSPFDHYVLELCRGASRSIRIMSPQLDHAAFDSPELAAAISALARDTRQSQVRILINDSRALVYRGHSLLQLARRLPSAVQIRKLEEHPDWNGETVVIKDHDGLLYKPGDSENEAFCEPASRASTRRHLELFEELWRFSVEDPDLRSLRL